MLLERRSNISIKEFEGSYLSANKPVIITDAMNNWEIFKKWSPDYLCDHFEDQETQLYDNLFNCIGIIQLGRSRNGDCSPPPPQIRTGATNASGSCLR